MHTLAKKAYFLLIPLYHINGILSSQCQDQFNSFVQLQLKRKNFLKRIHCLLLWNSSQLNWWTFRMICCYGNGLPKEWKRIFHHYLTDNAQKDNRCKYKRFPLLCRNPGSMRQMLKVSASDTASGNQMKTYTIPTQALWLSLFIC